MSPSPAAPRGLLGLLPNLREEWVAMESTLRLRFYSKKMSELRTAIQELPSACADARRFD